MDELRKVYCFDIDGTICSQITDGHYENAVPYMDRIKKVNDLFLAGNRVIFYTARGMNRFSGNLHKVNETYYDLTYHQLLKWGVRFDRLILGKPSYDYFIDDKGENANEFFK